MPQTDGHDRNVKTVLEYDGSDFCGWQIQPNLRTVQEEMENAIFRITGERPRVTGAGRTDAGVHALGQVASFRLVKSITERLLKQALNAVLPDDIRVLDLRNAPDTFDARRDALHRTYRYVISNRPRAVGRQYAYHPKLSFSLESMVAASDLFKGKHCWKAFCRNGDSEGECVSTVTDIQWETDSDEIRFEITAERFFHNMVRIIIGTLFDVGRGKMPAEQLRILFERPDRTLAGTTLPPHGLFLLRVGY
ncbi:MAG TPA: tRNA pseudouridine(38-40) synthase TruA [bacterium]